jgi:hypothetical protein
MVTLDRIRLTGLLRKKPWKQGFFYARCFTGDSSGAPRDGPDGGFMEPLGAVARRDRWSCRLRAAPRRQNQHVRARASLERRFGELPSARRVNARRGSEHVRIRPINCAKWLIAALKQGWRLALRSR